MPVACLVLGLLAAPGLARAADLAWSGLRFSASKVVLHASTNVRVESASPEVLVEVEASDEAGKPRSPSGKELVKVVVDTELPFGRHEVAEAFVDPFDGRILQLEKNVSGTKAYWKLYRFTEHGCFEWRRAPEVKKERRLGKEGWTRRQERWLIWSPKPAAEQTVTDGYALIYLVGAARLDLPDASLRIVVPTDERLVEIEFVPQDLIQAEVDFERVNGADSTREQGERRLRLVHGTARYLGTESEAEDADTGFMGMQGALEILVEPGTGMPVQVAGRSRGIGRLVVRLERAEMAPRGPTVEPPRQR